MSEQHEQKRTWGRWFGEQMAGTAIIATTMAGVGAAIALKKGKPIAPEAGAFAALGTVGGLGMGGFVYSGLFPSKESKRLAPQARFERPVSWTERVSSEQRKAHHSQQSR